MDVVVVGSTNTDMIAYASHLPLPGETVHGNKFVVGFGGKGANQCVMAAKLRAKTAMVTMVGDDSFGRDAIQNYTKNGVDTTHILVTTEAPSGVAPITVSEETGQNSIVIIGGANELLSPEHIRAAEATIKSGKVLMCQMEIKNESTLEALRIANAHGVKSILNVAPAQKGLAPEFFSLPDIFCVNETEAEIVTGMKVADIQSAEACALYMRNELKAKTVIITLGSNGSYFLPQGETTGEHSPAEKVQAVDTSGAGDSFLGAFGFYLARYPDLPMREMVRRAGSIASKSVTKKGTQSSYPSREELPEDMF